MKPRAVPHPITAQRKNTSRQRALALIRQWWFFAVLVFGVLGAGYFPLRSGREQQPPIVHSDSVSVPAISRLPVIGNRERATFLAVGDIMLSRAVAAISKQHQDRAYPFRQIVSYMNSADFVFGNFETPITPGREIQNDELTFRSDPGVEADMAVANIEAVSLANNHVPNFGEQGILDTLALLHAVGIQTAGAGKNLAQALQPAVITKNGLTIAFLAYNDTDVVPESYGASDQHAGTAFMDIPTMQTAVRQANDDADIVVVSMHSGIEYAPTPNASQQRFAYAAIDAGADLVLGHHPHVVQPAELYKGKYIFYSLGNFIFDQPFSDDTKTGMTAVITVSKKGVDNITFQPVFMEHAAQPRLLVWPEAQNMIKRLAVPMDAAGNVLRVSESLPASQLSR